MTNDERKEYLIRWHRLIMQHHDAVMVDRIPDDQALGAYNSFLAKFFEGLYPLQPKKFYRYRKFSEKELENLQNGTAWFSHPDQFDDSLDTALNIDLETEIDEILGPEGDKELKKKFMASFVTYLLKKAGIETNPELIETAIDKTEDNGFDDGIMLFFSKYLDTDSAKSLRDQTHEVLNNVWSDKLQKQVLGWVNNYLGSNQKIRGGVYDLCLAEDGNNDAMWGTYADNCRGFVIEYQITPDTVLGSMILSNLFPIYYGEKEKIRLVDILRNGFFNLNNEIVVEGITQSDYEKFHISSYTKLPVWGFQKEWRVTYGDKNLQPFPFATAVILGERMDLAHKEAIIALAHEKGLSVFERKLNRSGSKILCEKLF